VKHRFAIVPTLTLTLALGAGVSLAQPANPRVPPGRAALRNQIPRPVNVPFEPIYKKDEAGKVAPLVGHYDLIALKNNPTVSDETLAKITPALRDWLSEVDRITIDNLDFIEELKGGLIDNVQVVDAVQLRKVTEMMQQLMSAGAAARTLNELGLLDQQQAGVNQQIINDYQQALMNQVRPAGANQQQLPKAQQEEMAAEVNRLLYRFSANDTFVAHDRLLVAAAPKLKQVLAGVKLSGEAKTKAEATLPAAASATSDAEKIAAVQGVLRPLSFAQRQDVLRQVAQLRGPVDPWAGTPDRPANIPANKPSLNAGGTSQPEKR
jgi:hypothetical protein